LQPSTLSWFCSRIVPRRIALRLSANGALPIRGSFRRSSTIFRETSLSAQNRRIGVNALSEIRRVIEIRQIPASALISS
jgi:hypothetical protein